ncbi:MAG: NAD(P)-binding domain-containing protein [bacterium]|nr:NAD(P)-binding domain-containing protein [bacterium]
MKIGVLGTGMVGKAIAGKLVQLGHEVCMGSRSTTSEAGATWAENAGSMATFGTFADAALHGELLFNCTNGAASIDALKSCEGSALAGKVLIDVANPLDFSKGMPPTLFVCNDDSLAERIQSAFPDLKVVKTLNTVNASIMVDASLLPGNHDLFVSGNDADAKAQVKQLLHDWFGWKIVHDLGDITTARGTEMILPLWIRLWGTVGSPMFNLHVQTA